MIHETLHRATLPVSLPFLMSMEDQLEILLKNELSKIKFLNDNIYPLYVPESVKPPYIAYVNSGGEYGKDLQGYDGSRTCIYEINILSERYGQLKLIEKNVLTILKKFIGKKLNESYIQDISIGYPREQYEEAIKLHRSNIEFTVYY